MMILSMMLGLSQMAPVAVRLDHYGAPLSQSTQSAVRCGGRTVRFEFIADRQGVRLKLPPLSRDRRTQARLNELDEHLSKIGNVRSWSITCFGNDPIIVFRGHGSEGDAPAVISVETYGGVVSDYSDRDPMPQIPLKAAR